MKNNAPNAESIPIQIVGSSNFGRDPKIMASRTFNMIVADDFLVDFFGYTQEIKISDKKKSRGLFGTVKGNFIIFVVSNTVYSIKVIGNGQYDTEVVGTISSFSGDVFIDENNTNQIAICDQTNIYIYNYVTSTFQVAVLPAGFIPGYVTYQNGRFVTPDKNSNVWALSAPGDGLNWFWGASGEPVLGALQTKPDFAVATIRFPSRGNLLLVMGRTVTELWTDVGGALFPYQKNSSVNIDYGCVNPSTIASSDTIIAWLGINEKSGPVIMYSTGADIKTISTDGIDYKIGKLSNPEKSSAAFFKLSGHLIYQLTFYDPADNFSICYDFTTGNFFDVTDEHMNFHITHDVTFFDNAYYFSSFNDGNLYKMDISLHYYDYGKDEEGNRKIFEIPRIRICPNLRIANASRFAINNVTFTMEQGNDTENSGNLPNYNPRIGLSLSKDGGISFGPYVDRPIYRPGRRMNRLNWWGCGAGNDMVLQFRFHGRGPWVATNGVVSALV